ncbi:3-keto-5-aminohexanoate cleavage protein [Bacillus sp. FJAT-49705]|uniref:3-keto-5-aminohexanoate cleavage protein n=1 Tax=Cytobacillus citreus TaxID=2833586 RepID=A0ABS5P0I9_9BACI|nr:3-keto-5-aminohexanoate cleavage protein [Cytobacillus citreus]MBS4192709.1 3-keto-5-aminohexanoate cleavage protein [Cytobacillus citreus]
MEKLIITAAVTGGITSRKDNPNLPITPDEIAQEVYDCWKAGASIAHIHARENDGSPSQRVELYQEIVSKIRERCDIIINLTTTGWGQSGKEEDRWNHLVCKPEMSTFTPGSMNRKDSVMINHPSFVRKLAEKTNENGIKPEIEIFDFGMIDQAVKLAKQGFLKPPLHFQFVLGVPGGIPANSKNFLHLTESIPQGSTWSIAAVGKDQLSMNLLGIILGGHIRTGLEDNVYYRYRELAKSNAQLVKRLAAYASELNREIATPTDARKILGLK